MKKKLIAVLGFVFSFSPLMVFAQNAGPCATVESGTIQSFICKIGNVLDTAIPVLIIGGVAFFVYGVVSYMIAGDEEGKKKGKDKIIYGIIGLVVIVAMWGLVGIITNTFDLNGTTQVNVPTLPL